MKLIRKDKHTGMSVKVEWEDLGEGISGDYNPDDPTDVSLYRFDIYAKTKGGDWQDIDDASYCTQVPVETDEKILKEGLKMIMVEIFDAVVQGASIKKACEQMSWISVKTIKSGIWEREWVL